MVLGRRQMAAGRNIILLSDGTGNSSISSNKSNVWRLLGALDLGPNANGDHRQFAFYDDGVGTSGFKPLRLLGGAFGWGLSRNVRELYRKLCRHYEPGDKIYIFGFSRGAFTARVLAHLISTCGILDRSKPAPGRPDVTMATDRGLRRGVKQAYKSYRRRYWDTAEWLPWVVSRLLRFFRNKVFRMEVLPHEEFRTRYSLEKPAGGEKLIEFIGVWDTVDALGLPIDELAVLIDRFVYPYKFPNQVLSGDVRRARQALAVDDERQTFHPLLWDEQGKTDTDRIKQVWFTGMHSNVGGGYPEDNLAYVTLAWMIDELKAAGGGAGLIFNDHDPAAFHKGAEPLGKLYNSRRGAAVYYRYKPRNIDELCNQESDRSSGQNRVSIKHPLIHHSVLDRITDMKVGYAPIALPKHFHVVDASGAVLAPQAGDPYYEIDANREIRDRMMQRAQGHVFWRRVIYFCILIATFALVLMPHYEPAIPGSVPDNPVSSFWRFMFDHTTGFLPGFVRYWTDAWTQSATIFTVFVIIFAVMFVWSYWVAGNIQKIAEAGWWHWKGNTSPRYAKPPGIFERFANWIRPSALGRFLQGMHSRFALPVSFSLICIYLVIGGGYRTLVHYPFVKDGVCNLPTMKPAGKDGDPVTLKAGVPQQVSFPTSDPCYNTGIELEAGRTYRVVLTEDPSWSGAMDQSGLLDPLCSCDYSQSSWKDHFASATPQGLTCLWKRFHWRYLIGLPARRELLIPWFTLTGEIGRDSRYVFPLNRKSFDFVPPKSDTLYLYVNDAINTLGLAIPNECDPSEPACKRVNDGWDANYLNNEGTAALTITKVRP
jgi:uncharacterized protein (DUF2235 family)